MKIIPPNPRTALHQTGPRELRLITGGKSSELAECDETGLDERGELFETGDEIGDSSTSGAESFVKLVGRQRLLRMPKMSPIL